MPNASKPGQSPIARLIRGSGLIFACRIGGAGLTFLTQILLARWMGAAGMGVYVLAFAWCALLSTLTVGGLHMAAIRFIGEGLAAGHAAPVRGFVRRARQLVIAGGVVLACSGAALVALSGMPLPDGGRVAFIAALAAVPLYAGIILHSGIANALSRFLLSFGPGQVLRPLLFMVAIAAVYFGSGELDAGTAMLLQLAVIGLVSAGVFIAVSRAVDRKVAPARPSYDTGNWVRTALPLLAVAMFEGYFQEFTVILAGFWLPSEEIAVYHVGYRVALLIAFGLFAVDAYVAPDIAGLYARGASDELQRVINRATRLRFWAALAGVITLALLGRPLLSLFGPEFVAGYPVLLILLVAQLVLAGVGPVTRLMSVSGRQDACIPAFAGAVALAVVLFALLVPAYGRNGAAAAALVDIVFWALWMRHLVVRHTGVRPSIFAPRAAPA